MTRDKRALLGFSCLVVGIIVWFAASVLISPDTRLVQEQGSGPLDLMSAPGSRDGNQAETQATTDTLDDLRRTLSAPQSSSENKDVSTITIRLRDENGVPQSGARLDLGSGRETPRALGVFDDRGEISIEITNSLEGYVYLTTPFLLKGPNRIALSPGESCTLVCFAVRCTISGIVFDEQNNPLSGASVLGPTTAVGSSHDGSFSLPVHSQFTRDLGKVSVIKNGFESWGPVHVDVSEGDRVITPILKELSPLTLDVVRPDGGPIGEFDVHVWQRLSHGLGHRGAWIDTEHLSDGRAVIRGLGDEKVAIGIVPSDARKTWYLRSHLQLDLKPTSSRRVLATVEPTRSIHVAVRIGDAPAPEAVVGYFSGALTDSEILSGIKRYPRAGLHEITSAATDDLGDVKLDIPIEPVRVWARYGARQPRLAWVDSAQTAVEFNFEGDEAFETTLDPSLLTFLRSCKWQDIHVVLEKLEDTSRFTSSTFDADGQALISCSPGSYTVVLVGDEPFYSPGMPAASTARRRLPMGTCLVQSKGEGRLHLPEAASWRFGFGDLTVLQSNDPLRQVEVVILGEGLMVPFYAVSNIDGSVRVALPEGDYRVEVTGPEGSLEGDVKIAPGHSSPIVRVHPR